MVSLANSSGLFKISEPYLLEIFRISSQSLLTIVFDIYFDFRLDSIVQSIRGLPASYKIFFLGSPFDPPRAGIIEIIFTYKSLNCF